MDFLMEWHSGCIIGKSQAPRAVEIKASLFSMI